MCSVREFPPFRYISKYSYDRPVREARLPTTKVIVTHSFYLASYDTRDSNANTNTLLYSLPLRLFRIKLQNS